MSIQPTPTTEKRRGDSVQRHAIALQNLVDRIEEHGLAHLEPAVLASIPTTLAAASTALAVARGEQLDSPMVRALEHQIFRLSELLRHGDKKHPRTLLTHLLYTLPQRLWAGFGAQLVALALIVCGAQIGYRTVAADSLRALSYFPEGISDYSIGHELLNLGASQAVQMWLQAPMSDIAFLLVSFDVHLFLFFGGFIAAALLCMGLGGVLTPLLLLSFGGAWGAIFGVLPIGVRWEVGLRLWPMFSMLTLALMLAQSAGFQMLCAYLPDRSGRPRRRAAHHLQSAFVQAMFSGIHLVLAALLSMQVITRAGGGQTSAIPQIVATLWAILFVGYTVWANVARTPMGRALFQQLHGGAPDLHLPYKVEPPAVHEGRIRLDLQEGASMHVTLARMSDRIAASAIDALIIGLWLVLYVAQIFPRIFADDAFSWNRVLWASLLLVGPILSYQFIAEWRWQGQTVGKRLFEIRSIRLDGERMDIWTTGLRALSQGFETIAPIALAAASYFATRQYVWFFVGIAILFTVIVQAFPLLNLLRQRLGDRMTGTVIIELPDRVHRYIPPLPNEEALVLTHPRTLTRGQHHAVAAVLSRARRGEFQPGRLLLEHLEQDTRIANWSDAAVSERLESLYAHCEIKAARGR